MIGYIIISSDKKFLAGTVENLHWEDSIDNAVIFGRLDTQEIIENELIENIYSFQMGMRKIVTIGKETLINP